MQEVGEKEDPGGPQSELSVQFAWVLGANPQNTSSQGGPDTVSTEVTTRLSEMDPGSSRTPAPHHVDLKSLSVPSASVASEEPANH